jgi:hypothetical protein
LKLSVNVVLPGGRYVKAGQELPDDFELPEHLRPLLAAGESDQADDINLKSKGGVGSSRKSKAYVEGEEQWSPKRTSKAF